MVDGNGAGSNCHCGLHGSCRNSRCGNGCVKVGELLRVDGGKALQMQCEGFAVQMRSDLRI